MMGFRSNFIERVCLGLQDYFSEIIKSEYEHSFSHENIQQINKQNFTHDWQNRFGRKDS